MSSQDIFEAVAAAEAAEATIADGVPGPSGVVAESPTSPSIYDGTTDDEDVTPAKRLKKDTAPTEMLIEEDVSDSCSDHDGVAEGISIETSGGDRLLEQPDVSSGPITPSAEANNNHPGVVSGLPRGFEQPGSLLEMGVNSAHRVVHDVVLLSGRTALEQLCERLLSTLWRHIYVLVVYHPATIGEHGHLVHVCRWDNRQRRCGCSGIRNIERTERRSVIKHTDRSEQDFERLLQYLLQGPRRPVLQKAPSTLWVDLRLDADRQLPQPSASGAEGVVASDGPQCSGAVGLDGRRGSSQLLHQTVGGPNEEGSQVLNFRKATPANIAYLINKICTFPMHNAKISKPWEQSRTCQFILAEDKIYKRACEYVQLQCVYRSTRDFESFYENKKPLFRAYDGSVTTYYMSMDDSIASVDALLMYQCNNDRLSVKDFLTSMISILDKKIPKKNCSEIESPPSAGKNFFIDMVLAYYLNSGNIANFNRNFNSY